MVFDFSKLNLKDRPSLILKTLSGKTLQTLGYANNVSLKVLYNEASVLNFTIPKYVNGKITPNYDNVVGWRIIEMRGLGRFLLLDPKTTNTGIKEIKSCMAYSLEFEWTFKQITITEDVYNFWNPAEPEGTLLGKIMDLLPAWKLGTVAPSLIGVYRSFEKTSNNVFNFVKSTVQKSVGCIFEFDTMTRTVNIRDVSSRAPASPIYLSTRNLIKQLEISEDSQSIVTCLDVNGAEGVDILSVNPTGLNQLYNLDYFMTETNFTPQVIKKWNAWKTSCENYRQYYFDVTMEKSLQDARYLTEQSVLNSLEIELSNLEKMQAGVIQADKENSLKEEELGKLKTQIDDKTAEVSVQKVKLDSILNDIAELTNKLEEINKELSLQNIFTAEEYAEVSRYFREDSLQESTFVAPPVKSYNTADMSNHLENSVVSIAPVPGMPAGVPGIEVTKTFHAYFPDKILYSIKGGKLTVGDLAANIHRGSYEQKDNGEFVLTAYLGTGKIEDREFTSGCVSMTGTATHLRDNTVPDKDTPNSYATGTEMSFTANKGNLYFTENLTTYQQRSVEWDLLEWGQDAIRKLSQPSYTFSVDSANFIALDEFTAFKDALLLGNRCWLNVGDGKVLQPVVIGIEVSFSDISAMAITFSNKYSSSDAEFKLAELLEQSISMGKTVDYNKYSYNSFVESGAANKVDDFISNALDVAKNKVLSATGQAISWDENGMKFRKWNESHTGYEPEQMWAINNELVFTDNAFQTVKTAVGKIKVGEAMLYGISAEALFGNILAGNNLVIESEKKDGKGNSVFRVDGSGAQLHNATFDIFSGSNQHITLNPDVGFAMGEYPVYNPDGTINMDNAKVFFDIKTGGAVFKGRVEADSGSFHGTVTAKNFFFDDGTSVKTLLSSDTNQTQIPSDFLNLYGLAIYEQGYLNKPGHETFQIKSNGDVSLKGNITMQGGSINWNTVGHDPWASSALDQASDAKSMAEAIASGSFNPSDWGISNTFIDGNMIYSPKVMFGGGAVGQIFEGQGNNGVGITQIIQMTSNTGIAIAASGGGLRFQAKDGIWVNSSMSFIPGCRLYLQGLSTTVDIAAYITRLENRIAALEKQVSS